MTGKPETWATFPVAPLGLLSEGLVAAVAGASVLKGNQPGDHLTEDEVQSNLVRTLIPHLPSPQLISERRKLRAVDADKSDSELPDVALWNLDRKSYWGIFEIKTLLKDAQGAMNNSIAALVGGVVGSTLTLVSSWISSATQKKIAAIHAEKEMAIHVSKIRSERLVDNVKYEREKLERLHKILSLIAFENSQTCSFIDSDGGLGVTEFWKRYRENCIRMDEASAIIDMHYPELAESMRKIYSQANVFWGSQEGVLRTDIKTASDVWQMNLSHVLDAAQVVNEHVSRVQHKIRSRSKDLIQSLEP